MIGRMVHALTLTPLVAGLLAFWLRADGPRRLAGSDGAAHAGLTINAWRVWSETDVGSTRDRRARGHVGGPRRHRPVVSDHDQRAVFWLRHLRRRLSRREKNHMHIDYQEHLFFSNEPEAVFTGCMLLFLSSMTLVCTSQHFGLLWVGVEATTLASAPLIYFHRQHRSLEATWKYLLICSVGIALALLGNFLLAVAASTDDRARDPTCSSADLIAACDPVARPAG